MIYLHKHWLGLKKKVVCLGFTTGPIFMALKKKLGSRASLIAIFYLHSDVENTCHYADFDTQRNL